MTTVRNEIRFLLWLGTELKDLEKNPSPKNVRALNDNVQTWFLSGENELIKGREQASVK